MVEIRPLTVQSICQFDLTMYPFDIQECRVLIRSTLSVSRLTLRNDGINFLVGFQVIVFSFCVRMAYPHCFYSFSYDYKQVAMSYSWNILMHWSVPQIFSFGFVHWLIDPFLNFSCILIYRKKEYHSHYIFFYSVRGARHYIIFIHAFTERPSSTGVLC